MKNKFIFYPILASLAVVGCNDKGSSNATTPSGSSAGQANPPSAQIISDGSNIGNVTGMAGTYTNCRTSNTSWSVGFNYEAGVYSVSSNTLNVFPGESSCVLTVTSFSLAGNGTYASNTGIPLSVNFAATPVQFTNTSANTTPQIVYANGLVFDPTFSTANNQIILRYSTQANIFSSIGFPSVTGGASIGNISAPDYTILQAGTNLTVMRNAPSQSGVMAPSSIINAYGNVMLNAASQTGESYVVVTHVDGIDSQSLANAYNAADPTSVQPINNDIQQNSVSFAIPASAFFLVNSTDLPVFRTVIIKHTDTTPAANGSASSISTYEAITIPFY